MKPYFSKKASGLNADLARHSKEEMKLRSLIQNSESSDLFLKTYKELLAKLLQSKAEVAAKLGV
jgi:hypothetical protein